MGRALHLCLTRGRGLGRTCGGACSGGTSFSSGVSSGDWGSGSQSRGLQAALLAGVSVAVGHDFRALRREGAGI